MREIFPGRCSWQFPSFYLEDVIDSGVTVGASREEKDRGEDGLAQSAEECAWLCRGYSE
jgi:hypothetical protein